jgi:hypothetical protein
MKGVRDVGKRSSELTWCDVSTVGQSAVTGGDDNVISPFFVKFRIITR